MFNFSFVREIGAKTIFPKSRTIHANVVVILYFTDEYFRNVYGAHSSVMRLTRK